MTTSTLVFSSLRHYWRTDLGVVLGAMVSTAVLVGALAVGDSVRHTLRSAALARLGNIESAMDTGDRFFREALADEMRDGGPGYRTAPVLRLRGIAANSEGTARANNVQVLGVDACFWRVGGFRAPVSEIADDQVVLNERLAAQLGARIGDEVLLRVDKPSALSRDAPLVPTEDASRAMRLTVAAVATDAEFGRFSLQANQVAPYNAFVQLKQLQSKFASWCRANLLLVSSNVPGEPIPPLNLKPYISLLDIGADLDCSGRIEVHGTRLPTCIELRSERVFLDPPVCAAAAKADPAAIGVLTYFVNEMRLGDRTTPYSTVAAIGLLGGARGREDLIPVPSGVADDEVVINTWLRDDLQAKPGDELEMTYFVVGLTRKLVEHKSRFRVRDIAPIEGWGAGDRDLMPDFPGVADVDNCRDWKPGIPIDLKKIRKKDEDYWKGHRGTPKAFISLAAGRKVWANRFGDLTAVRFYRVPDLNALEKDILKNIDPTDFGLVFRPVRQEALKGTEQGVDFGQLFLGLSFFLIAAAVLLMGLLFVFGIEQRAGQVGLLLALGFTPRRVRRLMMAEGMLLALAGGVAGAFAGTVYTRGVLAALSGVWSGAVAGTAVQYHAETTTLLMGGGIGFAVAVAAMWLTLRRQARRPAHELLTGSGAVWSPAFRRSSGAGAPTPKAKDRLKAGLRTRWFPSWLGLASIAGAIAIVVALGARRDQAAAMGFFGAGALLLVGGIALCYGLLSPAGGKSEIRNPKSETNSSHQSTKHETKAGQDSRSSRGVSDIGASSFELVSDFGFRYSDFRLRQLGWRNATRRRGRSLAVVALLACASFLVFAVGANRKDPLADAAKRSSGTGGFAFYGETALPVFEDLNSPEGRKAYGLDPEVMKDVKVVPLRVHDGDDASCLNLNRAQQPRILGVNPQLLKSRKAFTFVKTLKDSDGLTGWDLFGVNTWFNDWVPAIGDEATVTWGLGKKVGDAVLCTDGRGRHFHAYIVGILANSILQGSLLIAEDEFIRLFPSDEGYRAFLVSFPVEDEWWEGRPEIPPEYWRPPFKPEGPDDVMLMTLFKSSAPRWKWFLLRQELSRALGDEGIELVPAVRRLAEFGAVENTYLSIFQALGGLAMLLGSVGLGVAVLRNVMERRSELALMRAVGFRKRALVWLVLSEHWGLLVMGLAIGTVSAVVAVLPALRSPGADVPYISLVITLVAVAASGLVWTWLAALAALRGPLLNALRHE